MKDDWVFIRQNDGAVFHAEGPVGIKKWRLQRVCCFQETSRSLCLGNGVGGWAIQKISQGARSYRFFFAFPGNLSSFPNFSSEVNVMAKKEKR